MEIIGASIVATSQVSPDDKPYTVYLIEVRCRAGTENFTVATFRRYSEFRAFDHKLTAIFPRCRPFPFPPKRAFGNSSANWVSFRTTQLQHYLDTILQNPRIALDKTVVNFLCPIVERKWLQPRPGASLLKDSVGFVVGSARARSSRIGPLESLVDLPEEVLLVVLSFLGYRDLLSASLVCRAFYVVASHNFLWQQIIADFAPAWPGIVAPSNARQSRIMWGAKRQFLKMAYSCTPQRRAYQPPSQVISCQCQLRKVLGVAAGPACVPLRDSLAGIDRAQQGKGPEAKAKTSPPPTSPPIAEDDPGRRLMAMTGITKSHVETTKWGVCFYVHTEGTAQDPERALRHLLLRSNFALLAFFVDVPESLQHVQEALSRIRYHCARIPVFLVGIPSPAVIAGERRLDDGGPRVSRLHAMDAAVRLGALKYIELTGLVPKAAKQLLTEVGNVLAHTLTDLAFSFTDEHTEAPSALAAGVEDDDDEPPISAGASQLIQATARWQRAQVFPARQQQLDDPASRRLALAVLRGARQHFIMQLQQFALDNALREFMRSTLPIDAKATAVKSFLTSMVAYVHGSSLWLTASEKEKKRVAREIEEYVYERLYRVIFRPPQDQDDDEKLERKIGRLSFVLPSHLEIPKQYWDHDAWQAAVEELLEINYAVSPFSKMRCVMNCAKILLHLLHSRCHIKDTSADHFLPHFVYVVLKANPPFLASNLSYVSRFGGETAMFTESYYYLTSLEVAVGFIQQLNYKSLHISEEDFARLTSDQVTPLKINVLSIKRFAAKAYKVFGIDPSDEKVAKVLGQEVAKKKKGKERSGAHTRSSFLYPPAASQATAPAAAAATTSSPSSSPNSTTSPPAVASVTVWRPGQPKGKEPAAASSASSEDSALEESPEDDGSEINRDRRERLSRMIPDLMLDDERVAALSGTPKRRAIEVEEDKSELLSRRYSRRAETMFPSSSVDDSAAGTSFSQYAFGVTRPRKMTPITPPVPVFSRTTADLGFPLTPSPPIVAESQLQQSLIRSSYLVGSPKPTQPAPRPPSQQFEDDSSPKPQSPPPRPPALAEGGSPKVPMKVGKSPRPLAQPAPKPQMEPVTAKTKGKGKQPESKLRWTRTGISVPLLDDTPDPVRQLPPGQWHLRSRDTGSQPVPPPQQPTFLSGKVNFGVESPEAKKATPDMQAPWGTPDDTVCESPQLSPH